MSRTATHGPRQRRKGGGGQGGGQKWITTYADAVTILMAFFVILYAMSEIDVIKFTAFLEGLRVPFGNEAGDALLPDALGLQPDSPPPPPVESDEIRELINEAEFEELEEQLTELLAAQDLDDEGELQDREDQLEQVRQALLAALTDEQLELFVEMRREERGLVVSIASDDVIFALGSTVINDVGRQVIRVVSETLDGFPNPLFIEGHTDNIPLDRGGYTNWNLSTDRAVAVLELMVEEHDLPPDRVGAVGYGEYHPLESNDNAEGRARNRRVDIVVLVAEEALDARRDTEPTTMEVSP